MHNFAVRPADRPRGRYAIRALVIALVVLATTTLGAGLSLAAPGGNGGNGGNGGGGNTAATFVDFAQCSNGAAPLVNLGCLGWINGILQTNNSHYAEDEVVPQRLEADLPAGGSTTGRTFTISYQARKGGIHAYDSLATWNLTQTTALRCLGLDPTDCVGGSPSTFGIPNDPTAVLPATSGGAATSGHMIPAGSGREMTMYGGTITGVSVPVHDNASSATGDDWGTVTVTYSVSSLPAKVQMLFGGHIAPSFGTRGWGTGLGAGSISGGPYHFKWTEADDESIGDRDNQIAGAAVEIPPPPPVPNVPPTVSCPAMSVDGLTVTYTATASDSDGTITSYHWVFGDGQTADTATGSTSHTYAAGGTYNVVVTVTDDDGDTGSNSGPCAVTVSAPPPPPPPPVENLPPTVSCPTMTATGLSVSYVATGIDTDGVITSYHWVFGDGQTADTATGSTSHLYAADGTYNVVVTVTDNLGATGSSSGACAVTVAAPPPPPPPPAENLPPVVACPTMTVDGLTVTYTATASDPDGTIEGYAWDFGDDEFDETLTNTTTHTYLEAGTYDIAVAVIDDDGEIGINEEEVCSVTVAGGTTPAAPAPTPQQPTVVLPVRRTLPRTGTDTTAIAWLSIALLFGGMLLRGVKPRPVRMVYAGQGLVAAQVAQYGLNVAANARPLRLHAYRRV